MLYSYAKLSRYDFGFFRLLGHGLGNLLLPWARFVVATKKYNLVPIEPTWPQIKIGPIIRGEKDPRIYKGFFMPLSGEISGLKKMFLLSTCKKQREPFSNNNFKNSSANNVLVFEGLGDYFLPIIEDHNFVYSKLLEMTRDTHKSGLKCDFTNCVCMHIRRADFKLEKWDTPIEWFGQIAEKLKNVLGKDIKIKVFSDGSDKDLAPLLRQESVERVAFGSAIADLLALSKAPVLVGSAKSTFSMWASYLGRMPTIWPQGGLFQKLHYDYPGSEIMAGSETELPQEFVSMCKATLIKKLTDKPLF